MRRSQRVILRHQHVQVDRVEHPLLTLLPSAPLAPPLRSVQSHRRERGNVWPAALSSVKSRPLFGSAARSSTRTPREGSWMKKADAAVEAKPEAQDPDVVIVLRRVAGH